MQQRETTGNGWFPEPAAGKTVADYLRETGTDPQRVAVERNGEILPRAQYAATRLEDGDVVEIVRFVGGG